jgi:type IV pilus biogenesis protein CpaD/CtpE
MRLTRSALALSLLALLTPALAAAQGQTCVLLPPPDGSTAPADAHARVASTITEELRTHGLVVMASTDARLRMTGQPMEECSAIDCAPDVNRFLGTTFAVLTELTWLRGRPTMINVVIIGLDGGASAGGQAVIERGGDLGAATRAAFQTAWDRWQADAQGQLVIDTSPEGAFVEIDGTSVGRSPIRHLVATGVHTVRVTLEGYETATRDVTIDRHEERALSFALEAASAAPPDVTTAPVPEERFEDRPHWANWAIGGGALALAVGLAITPIWTAASAGEVMDHGAAGTDTVTFGPTSAALAILSGACLIGGVVVLIVQPITEHVRVGLSATRLTLEGSF